MRLRVRCPAKINPFLSVGPPDPNGMHPLRVTFQAIDLCDELEITTGGIRTQFLCEGMDLPMENTVTKAVRLLSECAALPPLAIRLTKRIPARRGLGGGSSDAAGLLRAAARLLGYPVPERSLLEVARAVGADVAFFLVGGAARGRGYGDVVTPMDDPPTEWLVVAGPEVGCETAAAYRRLDAVPRVWRDFPSGGELHNDFELVAPEDSLRLKRRLVEVGARGALLCGSGSAVFGVFESAEGALQAAEALRAEGTPFVAATRSLSRSESLLVTASQDS